MRAEVLTIFTLLPANSFTAVSQLFKMNELDWYSIFRCTKKWPHTSYNVTFIQRMNLTEVQYRFTCVG